MKRSGSWVFALILALMPLLATARDAGGGELLRNVGFGSDGLDGVVNWGTRGGLADTLTILRGEGPGGCDAVRVHVPKGRRFSQDDITLVPGEVYRIGVWVRTKGLPAETVRFMVWPDWWQDQLIVGYLPSDTKGAWVKLETQAKMVPASSRGRYCFGFHATGKEDVTFDVAAPFLEPVSEKAVAGSKPASEAFCMKGRVVPLSPRLADVDADRPEILFYYPYDAEIPPAELELSVSVDGEAVFSASLDANRRVRVGLGCLTRGKHALRAVLRDAKGNVRAANDYPIEVVSHAYPAGRKLNNFVTELYRGPVAAKGEVKFVNPRRGWVWSAFEPADGGPESTTMRWLEPGEGALPVPGPGAVRIHAVKTLVVSSVQYPRTPHDWRKYQYGGAWYERHAFPFFNTYFAYGLTDTSPHLAVFRNAGCFAGPEIGISGDAWSDAKIIRERATESTSFRNGCDLELDEHAILNPRTSHYVTAEELWKIVGCEPAVNVFWCDSMSQLFVDVPGVASEISAICNTGRGRGMVYSETYFAALDDWNAAAAQVDYYRRLSASLRDVTPVGPSSLLLCFGGYIEQGGWNDYSSPSVDMKFLYDHFMRMLAVDPAFAEVGGTGLTAQHHLDEEMMRWLLKGFRHYFLEGRVEPLAARHGIVYRPGHLANADFERGLDGWTAVPAETGTLFPTNVAGYGKWQGRKDVPDGYGDSLVCFTRSAKHPNRLSCGLVGLVPGRLYHVTFYANDPDDRDAPGSVDMRFPFSVSVEGGESVPAFSYTRIWPPDRLPDGMRASTKAKCPLHITRHFLFRAAARDAKLTFSDWESETRPEEGLVGRRTYLNGICVRPYYDDGMEGLDE